MYTFLLVGCMLAMILSPLALDLWLSFREARLQRRHSRWQRGQKKSTGSSLPPTVCADPWAKWAGLP